jgi:hypothetical protein
METERGEGQDHPVENEPEEPGAEGGAASEDASKLPGAPASESEAEVGDTDQHSSA